MVVLDFTTAAVILICSFALGKVSLVQFLMQGNAVINMVSTLAGLLGPIIGGDFGYGGFVVFQKGFCGS